jgi:hypothetical protein
MTAEVFLDNPTTGKVRYKQSTATTIQPAGDMACANN